MIYIPNVDVFSCILIVVGIELPDDAGKIIDELVIDGLTGTGLAFDGKYLNSKLNLY